ncbi:Collectin-12 [Holothuria leucospilota]|uniref:Collectin-12 n=1 Tax=Holothuria leucospilota TaxID=206669 RepID=A0A9Q1B9Z1_HOLLE|nr:Collectin-12 [Holothuria leucospilota]
MNGHTQLTTVQYSSYCQGTTTTAEEAVSTNGDTMTTTKETFSTNGYTTTTTKETVSTNGDTTTTTKETSTNEDTTTTEETYTNGNPTTTTEETASINGCPAGFEYQNSCSCYRIVTSPHQTRLEAQQECERLSSHLVFIESEQEKQFLSQRYDPSLQYWLGLNGNLYETKTWDDGSIMVYSNLASHHFAIDDRSGCYRIISKYLSNKWCVGRNTWLDLKCSNALPYICEYELDGMNCTFNLETTATTVTDTDVGELFGLDHVDVYLQRTYQVDMLTNEWSVISCASKCTEVDCGAILFQYETSKCKMATLTDVTEDCNPVSVYRTFTCIHGPGYDLCY